jgi:hypothetical protein
MCQRSLNKQKYLPHIMSKNAKIALLWPALQIASEITKVLFDGSRHEVFISLHKFTL